MMRECGLGDVSLLVINKIRGGVWSLHRRKDNEFALVQGPDAGHGTRAEINLTGRFATTSKRSRTSIYHFTSSAPVKKRSFSSPRLVSVQPTLPAQKLLGPADQRGCTPAAVVFVPPKEQRQEGRVLLYGATTSAKKR